MVPAALLPDIPAELLAARDALAAIDGVASCQIGLEAAVSPEHFPLIRLVPARFTPGKPYHGRTCETLIYFGPKVANSLGLEQVYSAAFELEASILAVVRSLGARYVETVTDEDRLDLYKLMVARVEIQIGNVQPG